MCYSIRIMNIFVISSDQRECAQFLDNKRLCKMIVETAQMLCTAVQYHNTSITDVMQLYKPTHINHPCTRWVRASRSNYRWAYKYLGELLREYTVRFDKVHKTTGIYVMLRNTSCVQSIPRGRMTPFANCSGFDTGNIHNDYRQCLYRKWSK